MGAHVPQISPHRIAKGGKLKGPRSQNAPISVLARSSRHAPVSVTEPETDAAKRYKKVANAEALIWKILLIAEKKFRRLNAPELLEDVYAGKKFVDGVAVRKVDRRLAA
jgi:hypothetical protein